MILPAKVQEALQYMFSSYNPTLDSLSHLSLNDNEFFKDALKIEYGNNTEIPIFCCGSVVNRLPYVGIDKKEVYVPLFTSRPSTYKTTHMILKHLLRPNFYGSNIKHIRDGKGNDYYGCPGVIFNKDMTPIIMSTIIIGMVGERYSVKSINLRIHPCVFSSTGPIEKLIVSKIIPYYSTEEETMGFSLPSSIDESMIRDERGILKDIKITKLEISDSIEKFIFHPKPPTEVFNDSDINRMLLENAESVFYCG